jgi:hypothetical protein
MVLAQSGLPMDNSARRTAMNEGLTLVHFSAQRKHILRDMLAA